MLILNRPNKLKAPSPQSIQYEIISRIQQSEYGLKIAVTWFTNRSIFEAILQKIANPNYTVEMIVLNDRINNKSEGLDFQKFINQKGKFFYSSTENMVHHKFCIIDNKLVITGSYNWTYYAERRNWENVVVINDHNIVQAYSEEFDEITKSHLRVFSIASKRKFDDEIGTLDYLKVDYQIEAEEEQEKGNNLAAAKIYTELLRLDNSQINVQNERDKIIKLYNNQERVHITPFEIGILHKEGYSKVIPAFTSLPLQSPITTSAVTVVDDQPSIHITIQKRDIDIQTILELDLLNIQPSPKGTEKIQYTFNIDNFGNCVILVKELGGFEQSVSGKINLKNYR